MARVNRMKMQKLWNNAKVKMKNPSLVHEKLQAMVFDGNLKLIVISDFDYTLTRFHDENGGHCWTTHGVFDSAVENTAPPLGGKLRKLKEKYLPIEYDPDMTTEEKTPHMERWWRSAHKYILAANFRKIDIERFVEKAKLEFRSGTKEMISNLLEKSIPIIVFSAGIGNIIELFMKKEFGMIPDNIAIISNTMEFNEDSTVSRFKEPLIHTFTKNSSALANDLNFSRMVADRTNVLLLGDSLGDLNMDVGINHKKVVLKIGFLNFNISSLLEKFLDGYDIVIVDDQSMDIPKKILEEIQFGPTESSIETCEASKCNCHMEAAEINNEESNKSRVSNVTA